MQCILGTLPHLDTLSLTPTLIPPILGSVRVRGVLDVGCLLSDVPTADTANGRVQVSWVGVEFKMQIEFIIKMQIGHT